MFNLGLIPARKGSKRILNKNLKLLNGKPLIQYTIEAALKSEGIDLLIVSTDCERIADISEKLGATVPFLRPKSCSTDKSSDFDVIDHTQKWFKQNKQLEIDLITYLRPTTPLKTPQIINKAIQKSKSTKFSGLRSVSKTEGVFHPYWMYFSEDETLISAIPNINLNEFYQSQLLPNCYRLNGVVDIIKPKHLSSNSLYGDKVGYIEVAENLSIDIDTQEDFDYCEYIIKKMENNL